MNLSTIVMFLIILFLPRLIMLLVSRSSFLATLGPVFLCYLFGLLLSFPLKALGADIVLASDFSSVLVCTAMPLILFSADIPALKKLARPMAASFAMNTVSVILIATAAFFIFRQSVPDAAHISAMLTGTYTGGTPNMIAIGHGLGSGNDRILLLQASDMIGGGIYFFLLISVMPRLMRHVLPEYTPVGNTFSQEDTHRYIEAFSGRKQSVKPFRMFLNRCGFVLLSLVCVAIAMGICLLLPSGYGNTGLAKLGEYTAFIMLIVTTLGIALSFVKKVRTAPGSYSSGQYFILMFSVVMGLCFDLSAVTGGLLLLGMLLFIQFVTVILHIIMARIAGIDYHTMMITSTAGVFGPAFIMPVARALRNDEIVLPGILCGILGYAIGNYLGIGLGKLLLLFP
ncbi:DUF819 family protein [Thermoclostridium caenicola]|uniref:Uncharacterized membrane protein n=1 Tax=Thermoclostridium caenicola TaxID=659425 RepID=A0A1M6DWQ2_9FIRM|nr:DUF819 family protein [Thermoclostridium caenicola]SHI77595.1 Uncharacterized membrane protein [Thermoclostridium caenicola]